MTNEREAAASDAVTESGEEAVRNREKPAESVEEAANSLVEPANIAEESENIAEGRGEKKDGGQNRSTIFDDTFKTMLERMPRLVVGLINHVFDKAYPENVEIRQLKNDHTDESGKKVTDSVLEIEDWTYHLEMQSNPDRTMDVRMVEYDLRAALARTGQELERGGHAGGVRELRLPSSCVVYLRHTRNTPDEGKVRIVGDYGESMYYRYRIRKAQNYSLEELFRLRLFILLPYYVMRYEKQYPRMERDPARREAFLAEVRELVSRLEGPDRPELSAEEAKAGMYDDLMGIIGEIADYELRKYPTTQEGVREIMEGHILPLPSDLIRAKRETENVQRKLARQTQLTQEAEAQLAEKDRSLAEERRLSAEKDRSLAEERRLSAEKDRILAEERQKLREYQARFGVI